MREGEEWRLGLEFERVERMREAETERGNWYEGGRFFLFIWGLFGRGSYGPSPRPTPPRLWVKRAGPK